MTSSRIFRRRWKKSDLQPSVAPIRACSRLWYRNHQAAFFLHFERELLYAFLAVFVPFDKRRFFVPVKIIDNDFYSLHGIWGASSCLALGRVGKGAGMVVGNVQPPVRALYAGYRAGSEQPVFLPFIPDVKVGLGADAYVAADVAASLPAGFPRPQMFSCFGKGDIDRSMTMSGEAWRAGKMTLSVTSFFGAVPDPSRTKYADLRRKMCPAIYAKIAFDNSDGKEPLVGTFGLQGVRRLISDATGGALLGFAHQGDWGFATLPRDGVDEVMDWMVLSAVFDEKPRAIRHLAAEGCLRFRVPAGEKREYVIALGSYRDGVATSGLRTRLFQTTLFRDLEDVLFRRAGAIRRVSWGSPQS